MVNRRFAQVATSDDEDEAQPRRKQQSGTDTPEENRSTQRTRKRLKLQEEEDDEEELNEKEEEEEDDKKIKRKSKDKEEEDEEEEEASSEEEESPPKPIGEQVRVSGKGRGRRKHFESFEFDGNQYTLEDPVLLVPEDKDQKPYVAIIKDITQTQSGDMKVTGQWFYRPEEAEKRGGGSWQSSDTRELFYSFHRDEVPAESVMHKCVVHFVPIHKQLPNRKQHPGFIVQKVYDTVQMKLWKLTDKDYEDNKQQEIDELVQKTLQRLGEIPDIETDEAPAEQDDLLKNKRILKKKSMSPLDVSREEETSRKGDQPLKPETPWSCVSNTSKLYRILVDFNALTGDSHRDKGLEKLLESVQYMFDTDGSLEKEVKGNDISDAINKGSSNKSLELANECKDSIKKEVKGNDNPDAINKGSNNKSLELASECEDKVQKSSKSFVWPDVAVPAVVALEKASHDTLSSDYQKYNQKLRQLIYNLRNNAFLARRLLNGDLEPSKILNMTPNELKEGLTAEEIPKNEPDESQHMQMTDARCKLCDDRKVGLRDIIHTGHVDRYMLECITCGHYWSAPRDAVSVLTIEASKRNVGTAPWATAKFEDVEKKLVSPRESDKSTNGIFKKTSETYMPVLEAQKSFGKSRKDENVGASRHAD